MKNFIYIYADPIFYTSIGCILLAAGLQYIPTLLFHFKINTIIIVSSDFLSIISILLATSLFANIDRSGKGFLRDVNKLIELETYAFLGFTIIATFCMIYFRRFI